MRVTLRVTRAPTWAGQSGLKRPPRLAELSVNVAPAVRFELTTKRLTAARSTTELRRSEGRRTVTGRRRGAPSRRRSRGYQRLGREQPGRCRVGDRPTAPRPPPTVSVVNSVVL